MASKKKTEVKGNDRVTVIIPRPHNVTGDTETVVGVNGKMYQIQYDRPVEVPKNVAEVIKQSQTLQAEIRELEDRAIMKPGKSALAEL
ncbi:MAG: hypothetical protein IJH37_09630 [Clostridia bacterium]|nr:hypothetical protein [Clostridia bacterium]